MSDRPNIYASDADVLKNGESIHAYRCRAAAKTVRQAEDEFERTVKTEYPIGSRITWEVPRSIYAAKGSVILHGSGGERIKVHNDATGKEYWIATSRAL